MAGNLILMKQELRLRFSATLKKKSEFSVMALDLSLVLVGLCAD